MLTNKVKLRIREDKWAKTSEENRDAIYLLRKSWMGVVLVVLKYKVNFQISGSLIIPFFLFEFSLSNPASSLLLKQLVCYDRCSVLAKPAASLILILLVSSSLPTELEFQVSLLFWGGWLG